MTTEELNSLIEQWEDAKVDFKRQWYWNDKMPNNIKDTHKNELVKDLIALTNGDIFSVDKTAYLIIGIDDDTRKPFDFDTNVILPLDKLKQQVLTLLNNYAQPEFLALDMKFVNKVLIISIPPHGSLISLSKDLKLKNSNTDRKGTTYFRVGEDISVASSEVVKKFEKAFKNNNLSLDSEEENYNLNNDFSLKHTKEDISVIPSKVVKKLKKAVGKDAHSEHSKEENYSLNNDFSIKDIKEDKHSRKKYYIFFLIIILIIYALNLLYNGNKESQAEKKTKEQTSIYKNEVKQINVELEKLNHSLSDNKVKINYVKMKLAQAKKKQGTLRNVFVDTDEVNELEFKINNLKATNLELADKKEKILMRKLILDSVSDAY